MIFYSPYIKKTTTVTFLLVIKIYLYEYYFWIIFFPFLVSFLCSSILA